MAEQRRSDVEQSSLPLWVTIGDKKLANATPGSEEDAYIGEYPSDDALQSAVADHELGDYVRAAIEEVRRGASSSTETTSRYDDTDKIGDTVGLTPLPLWVTIGDEKLANATLDSEEGAYIGEYPSDDALQSAVADHELADYVRAAIDEVRRGASLTETTSPYEDGATDAP